MHDKTMEGKNNVERRGRWDMSSMYCTHQNETKFS